VLWRPQGEHGFATCSSGRSPRFVECGAQRDVRDGFNVETEAIHGVAVLCEVAAVMVAGAGWLA